MPDREKILLFDGSMEACLTASGEIAPEDVERASLRQPDRVLEVHRQYIAAGARAIQTNTFACNTCLQDADRDAVRAMVQAACRLAQRAAGESKHEVAVYGTIGPIPEPENSADGSACEDEYFFLIDTLHACGIRNFLFRSFSDAELFAALARHAARMDGTQKILCLAAVGPDGYSDTGARAQDIVNAAQAVPEIFATGFNGICGPAHMVHVVEGIDFHGMPACTMPNAGFPATENGRTSYSGSAEYFGERLREMAEGGVRILGGGAGTTPAHIAAARRALRRGVAVRRRSIAEPVPRESAQAPPLAEDAYFIATEIDPPLEGTGEEFFRNACQVADAGADLITVADCPVGRARGDSSLLASMLHASYDVDAMPHLTCRDRNVNASKALLLGLYMAGIENVLLVTGDPLPAGEREEVRSVFHFNSANLASMVRSLNETVFRDRPFRIMGALNVNAANFDAEMEKALRKRDAGMQVLLTQPVLDAAAMENVQRAREELGIPILAGIMPVISYRNACFMRNEMNGIHVPEELIRCYEGKSREECTDLAVSISLDWARRLKDDVDGYYIITMLKRADISSAIIREIKSWSLSEKN